ncbi:MAG: thioredoxin reductase [Frankiales bacterium]|nr:thioredoxin reductase [Frankiales bacterium]
MSSIEVAALPEAPVLTAEQLDAIARRGVRQDVEAGEVLYRAGDRDYDFIVLGSAEVDVFRPAMPGAAPELIVRWGPGRFLGELGLVTGQTAMATTVTSSAGDVYRLGPAAFRRLMDEDAALSDVILRALLERRESLRLGEGAKTVEILGSTLSAATHALRTWASRQQVPHDWLNFDEPAGQALARAAGVEALDLPAVIMPNRIVRRATPGDVAEQLGLTFRHVEGVTYDVTIVGGGPAGLAAAVYSSSEGLGTMLLDSVAVGGQAAASARIENYLGFPSGLSGVELASRALVQANKFGAHIASPCEVVALDCEDGHLHVTLSNGDVVDSKSVVLATGARYRTLPLEGWNDYEATGIYYAATELEARACTGEPVTVVGGANSAGQASLFLADRGSPVELIVRAPDLASEMSQYLVARVLAHPHITVRISSNVTGLHGDGRLEGITVTSADEQAGIRRPCRGLFCFIGAAPATGWLGGIVLDADGFVLTDQGLTADDLGPVWTLLGRRPLPFETSVPGVFAVGDVRAGSLKRVAAAVGEGASVIRSVHLARTPTA